MFHGELIGIFIGERKGHDLSAVDRVDAVAGRGLTGDRYFLKEGTYSAKDGPDREAFALSALRLGVLALRQATGAVDAASLRQEGERVLGSVRELLSGASA